MKFSCASSFALTLTFLTLNLSGCAEVKKIISVFSSGRINVNTTGFDIMEMSSGRDVTCAVMGDHSLRCLGSNTNGSLGRFYGAPNDKLKEVKQLALGKGFTGLISGENSALKCFGLNDKGQLGNGTQLNSVDPVAVIDPDNNNSPIIEAKQVTAGESHACALLKNGRAVCWGDNSFGQNGNQLQEGYQLKTIMENERAPKPFQGIQTIAAGGNSTCVIAKEDQSLFCFGQRFGITKVNNWTPEKVDQAGGIIPLSQVKQVALGKNFGCALTRSQVYCWGSNDSKQLGAPSTVPGLTKAKAIEVRYPVKAIISKIESIAVGDQHACALHRDEGTIFCWGNNNFGQLGTTSTHGLPEQVAVGSNNLTLKGAKYLAAGKERTCVISRSDELFCWGNGAHGILGNNTLSTPYPTRVIDSNNDMISGSLAISLGDDHACTVSANKQLYCFGINQYGQLGSRMIASNTLSTIINIDTYGQKTCVIYGEKRNIGCFGEKDLSINPENNINSFVLEDLKINQKSYQDVVAVGVGNQHICLATAEQQVECIDYSTKPANHYTVLTDKKTPLKDIWQIHSRGKLNCGITRDKGEIWCWGEWKSNQWNNAKQLTFAGKPTSDFIQISLTDEQICGISGVSGSVYCSVESEISQNLGNLQSLADQKGMAFAGALALTGGKHHMCVLNDKSELYCWGSNEFGQLGIPKPLHSNIPQRVNINNESHRKVARMSAGDSHTCFTTDTDLSIYCFGKSFFNEGNSSTPIEYPL